MCGLVGRSSYNNWPKLAANVGCTDAKTELSCMRGKKVDELLAGARKIPGATFPPPFVPTVDGKIVFDDYYERGDRGEFAKIVSDHPPDTFYMTAGTDFILASHCWYQRCRAGCQQSWQRL
jgi:hypothetical protein